MHRITRGQIEHILWCLRLIDRARAALADDDSAREEIATELKKSSDGIYHIVRDPPLIE